MTRKKNTATVTAKQTASERNAKQNTATAEKYASLRKPFSSMNKNERAIIDACNIDTTDFDRVMTDAECEKVLKFLEARKNAPKQTKAPKQRTAKQTTAPKQTEAKEKQTAVSDRQAYIYSGLVYPNANVCKATFDTERNPNSAIRNTNTVIVSFRSAEKSVFNRAFECWIHSDRNDIGITAKQYATLRALTDSDDAVKQTLATRFFDIAQMYADTSKKWFRVKLPKASNNAERLAVDNATVEVLNIIIALL